MAIFESDNAIDINEFGVPGVSIEQTLRYTTQPKNGLEVNSYDLTNYPPDYREYYNFISICNTTATLPDGSYGGVQSSPTRFFTGTITNNTSELSDAFDADNQEKRCRGNVNINSSGVNRSKYYRTKCQIATSENTFIISDHINITEETANLQCHKSFSYIFNSDKYWEADTDGRLSLGIYATTDNNTVKDNFTERISDDLFTQLDKPNLIKNGTAKMISRNSISINGYTEDNAANNVFLPQGGWKYITFDGVGENITKTNKPGVDYVKKFIQNDEYDNINTGNSTFGYAGYYPYIPAYLNYPFNFLAERIDGEDVYENSAGTKWLETWKDALSYDFGWAEWVYDTNCYSNSRCLKFKADGRWDNTTDSTEWPLEYGLEMLPSDSPALLQIANNNEYRVLNQYQQIYNEGDGAQGGISNLTNLNPFSSLRISFWMKTDGSDPNYDSSNPPYVESSIVRGGDPGRLKPHPGLAEGGNGLEPDFGQNVATDYFDSSHGFDVNLPVGDQIGFNNITDYRNTGYSDPQGEFNSITGNNRVWDSFGSINRFKNTSADNIWEKMEYTFNLSSAHRITNNLDDIKHLYFLIQSSGISSTSGFRGTVYIDNFEVKESYDFQPDCDVRKKIGPNSYGKADLTKYYDRDLQPEEYKDTTGPLEAQFYFYPRYEKNIFLDKTQESPIIHNDFRNGLFYIYDVDWGDGSPNEFTSEPEKLGENVSVYHTYESSGIFEVRGTVLRMKSDKDHNPTGIISNRRFVLRININEGLDEDFTYFGSEGFSFIPYKNTTPVVGGFSKQSIYYKSIKRQLGILSGDINVDTKFKNDSDKLKTQIALDRMDASYSTSFDLLNSYKEPRDIGELVVHNGLKTHQEELGNSIGDADVTNIKFYNTPKQMWEMLGFGDREGNTNLVTRSGEFINRSTNEVVPVGTPYHIHEGQAMAGANHSSTPHDFYDDTSALPTSDRYWKKIIDEDTSIFNRDGLNNTFIDIYSQQDWIDGSYYPVLPRYGIDGNFIENDFPMINQYPKIPFPIQGSITDENEVTENLKISINNNSVESNVFNDDSGNGNYGFIFNDYRPLFDKITLEPKKIKNIGLTKTSKNNGAF